MANCQVVLDMSAFRELIDSDDVRLTLLETAIDLANLAEMNASLSGAYYSVGRAIYSASADKHSGSVPIGHVWTNLAAAYQNRMYNTLEKAIDDLEV